MILRFCVVIPTYNNPSSIDAVARDVLANCPFPVLIVDDGSATPVEGLLTGSAREALHARLHLVRFEENRGKGAALRQAFAWGVAKNFTHMISFDGDGQHLASEIKKVVEIARQHPWDLVIGHRKFQSANVPGISKFGRGFSNFWLKYQTGALVLDSQSGFRSYPLFHVQGLKLRTRRYDFETEILVRLMSKGVGLREAEIEVFYPEPEKRVSHFHKFHDNVRITIVNILYVVLSLLRSQRSPGQLAIGVGMGVFIGCTPFFGFHTLMVAAFAFLFRVNAVAVWLGSQITIPPLAPFVILASIGVGKWMDAGGGKFMQWMLGSFALGIGLGLGAGVVTWIAARASARAKERKTTNWTGRSRGGTLGPALMNGVMRVFGRRAAYGLLYFVVPYFYLFAPKARAALNEYWSLVRPQAGWWARQAHVMRHLFVFAQILVDRAYQAAVSQPVFQTRSHGAENIGRALRTEKGAIFLCAHMGGWDLAAPLVILKGFSKEIYIVKYGEPPPGPTKVKWMNGQDPNLIFDLHQKLGEGKCIGFMGDRPMSERFELVRFLGRLAPMDVTPFRLAVTMRVPLQMTFGLKAEGDIYDFYADPPMQLEYVPGIPREAQLIQWMEKFVARLEDMIAMHPEQWFNFYEYWSSLPSLPSGETVVPAKNLLWEELPPSRPAPALAPTQIS